MDDGYDKQGNPAPGLIGPHADIQNIWAIDDSTYLFLRLEMLGDINFDQGEYTLYFDTDNDISTAEVDSSRLTGTTAGLYLASGTVSLGVTQLNGGATRDSGTLTCFQVYGSSYASYTCP